MRLILLFIYGAPTVIGIWWLILFSRETIKFQFRGKPEFLASLEPRPPLPIAILAWIFITTAAHAVLLPFLPFSMPLVLFGHFIYGRAGTISYAVLCIIFLGLGVGLLKLKPRAYTATIVVQLFFLTSGIVTAFSPGVTSQFEAVQKHIIQSLHLPPSLGYGPHFSEARSAMYVGLLVAAAVVVLLFYCRHRFLEASEAKSGSA